MRPEDILLKNLSADFLFSKNQDEKVDFINEDLIELKPYGMSLHNETTRPFLILKDETGQFTLPVGTTHLDAGVALTQSSVNFTNTTPHNFAESLLNSLDIKIERCVFIEIKGLHQYVRVYMKGHPRYQSLKFKAEDVMSLCLYLKVPLFASLNFIQNSKIMAAEVTESAKNLLNHPEFLNVKKQCH
jgi:uncharacterized protein